jgi:hypothetical protein
MFLMIIVIALCATRAVVARNHHRVPKNTAPAATKADIPQEKAYIPREKNRDPADVALDRKIRGICRGC